MEHRELRLLLDAMIRAANVSFEKSGNLLPFAITLNDVGKIAQLALPERPGRSTEETARSFETGLKTLVQQLTCKAVGFCSEIRFLNGTRAVDHAEIVLLLEHRDGCAYRVVFPDFLKSKCWNARRTASRFFAPANGKSFSTSTRW